MGNSKQLMEWREGRRLRAFELHEAGWKQIDIARALGVTRGAVSQWMKRAREGGREGLARRIAKGPTPRLTPERKAELAELLLLGAEHFGFRGDVWTRSRVGEVIKRQYGVSYDPSQVGRILRGLGFSRQKPMRRASQRNEQEVKEWRERIWPDAQKRGLPKGAR